MTDYKYSYEKIHYKFTIVTGFLLGFIHKNFTKTNKERSRRKTNVYKFIVDLHSDPERKSKNLKVNTEQLYSHNRGNSMLRVTSECNSIDHFKHTCKL